MAGNSIGQIFRLTTFGESHGPALGGVIDGCPAGLEIDKNFIQNELARRRPGQSKITTQRQEDDEVGFLSGIFEGKTTGAPIGFTIPNKDQKPKDYDHLKDVFRPSHGDYTYQVKYGHRDYRGGGRYSARETVSRVVGGAIAKLLIAQEKIKIYGYVAQVGNIKIDKCHKDMDLSKIDDTEIRCPDMEVAEQMIARIEEVRKEGDTIGGVVTGIITGMPAGLGEPVFDKLNADLAKAMMSIPAAKGFDCGWGYEGLGMLGSEFNDSFYNEQGDIRTKTNYSGGIQAGISNGEDIYFQVIFKPVSTIMKKQMTVNSKGEEVEVAGRGRHDPCVLPRAVPIVEAMAALVVADHLIRNKQLIK
ncbi:MAG TPA: chorismate synthase [Flavobacteriales bacterium]|nr:chorismate synthase [Flavobacteriales bacterium]HIA11549.1 chorismate synthase [Flavobacteriales bacterium]HIO71549.1 chorismate synthase [Flavobacteriales bacterium]